MITIDRDGIKMEVDKTPTGIDVGIWLWREDGKKTRFTLPPVMAVQLAEAFISEACPDLGDTRFLTRPYRVDLKKL